MTPITRRSALALGAGELTAAAIAAAPARADSAAIIENKTALALEQMFRTVAGARELHDQAKGVLIMPDIFKGGLIIGAAYGEGALRVAGETVGYYAFASGSLGFQIGLQSFKQALFFMTDAALAQFRAAKGWEIGADAEVTFPGDGLQIGLDSTSNRAPVIGVVFGQDGILAGISVQGGKYTPIAR